MGLSTNKSIQHPSTQTRQMSAQKTTSQKGNNPILPQNRDGGRTFKLDHGIFAKKDSANATKEFMQKTLPTVSHESRVTVQNQNSNNSIIVTVPAQRSAKPGGHKHYTNGDEYSNSVQRGIDHRQDQARYLESLRNSRYAQQGAYTQGLDAAAWANLGLGGLSSLMGAASKFTAPTGQASGSQGSQGSDGTSGTRGTGSSKSSSELGNDVKTKTNEIKGSCDAVRGISFAGLGKISSADTDAMNAAKDVDVQPKTDLTDIVNKFDAIKNTDISNILPTEIAPPDFVTDAQLSSLETVSTNISDLSTSIASASGRLDGTISKLQSRLNNPQFNATEVQAQIDKLTAAKTALDKMKNEISTINDALNGEKGPAKALPKQVKDAKALYQEQIKAQERENKALNDANKEVLDLMQELSVTKTDNKQNKKISQLRTALSRLVAANNIVTNRENAITTDDVKVNPDTTVAQTISDARRVLGMPATEEES